MITKTPSETYIDEDLFVEEDFVYFNAYCPACDNLNKFYITADEVANNFDFSCTYCSKQYPVDVWLGREEVEKNVGKSI